jgi:hypothetical protein
MINKQTKLQEIKIKLNEVIIYSYNFINKSNLSKWVLFTLFAVIEFLLIKEHVFGRDDARPILIARSSGTFLDLYNEVKYETSPMLYHLVLWIMNKIATITVFQVKSMFFISNLAILAVLIFYIEIPLFFKILLLLQEPTLGYLSYHRQYSWSILLILLFAHLYYKRGDKNPYLYLVLFLLCQTCVHGCISASGLYLFILINRYGAKEKLFKASDILIILGILLCIVQIVQPADIISSLKETKLFLSFNTLQYAFTFINQVFFVSPFSICGLCLIVWFTFKKTIDKNKTSRKAFILSVAFITTVFFIIGALKGFSYERHHWILSYSIVSLLMILNKNLKVDLKKVSSINYFFLILFLVSFINFPNRVQHYFNLKSVSNKVGEFLDKNYPKKITLHELDFMIDGVNVYRKDLNRYYSLNTHRFCMFAKWNHPGVNFPKFYNNGYIELKVSQIIKDLSETPKQILDKEPILILSADKIINDTKINLKDMQINNYKLIYLTQFKGVGLENFDIFEIKKI